MNPSKFFSVELDLKCSGSISWRFGWFSAACGLLLAAVRFFEKRPVRTATLYEVRPASLTFRLGCACSIELIARWVEPFNHPKPRLVK